MIYKKKKYHLKNSIATTSHLCNLIPKLGFYGPLCTKVLGMVIDPDSLSHDALIGSEWLLIWWGLNRAEP